MVVAFYLYVCACVMRFILFRRVLARVLCFEFVAYLVSIFGDGLAASQGLLNCRQKFRKRNEDREIKQQQTSGISMLRSL